MFHRVWQLLQRTFTTVYAPAADAVVSIPERAQIQTTPLATVTVAVLTAQESQRKFGVSLARRGVQAVFLQVENRHSAPLRLCALDIDPHYYTPLEAAGLCHFSILKRLSTFGLAAWLFLPLFGLLPLKLWTARRANRRMDDYFRRHCFSLRPVPPGETARGFIFTTLDAGSKTVRTCLYAIGHHSRDYRPEVEKSPEPGPTITPDVDLTFVIPVPGISSDYLHKNFADLIPESSLIPCDYRELVQHLRELPATTTNVRGSRLGDPANLVVIANLETVLSAFTARWDECETITLATCWKTARAFLFGTEYRYSPVSPLFLFGRSQDIALQRIRSSINERLHLRLWLTPLTFEGRPVWVGQISRDIGVRFTTHTWNLTTHRIDPDVDESRDYVVEDLLRSERLDAVGYVDGTGACPPEHPRHNLTGDPYFTDGKRAVILPSTGRTSPRFVAWT